MGTTAEYNSTAGRVVIDENEGHPGIKATTLSYGQINDECWLCWTNRVLHTIFFCLDS